MTQNFAPIFDYLAAHDCEFSLLRDQISNFKDEILTSLDAQTVILQRLDQERIFTSETIRRTRKQVEQHEGDIKQNSRRNERVE
jgi:hypothetical protein